MHMKKWSKGKIHVCRKGFCPARSARLSRTKLWQRSYYDHIVRHDADYLRIWQYIDENPARWAEDEYYMV